MSESNANAVLRQLFGDNRAEWPSANFKDLFVTPTYLGKLQVMRPCFLIGGRGTGKTTALQSLRYDSMLERMEGEGLSFADQDYLGILVRMNKNRVRAFTGSGIDEERWSKLFAHYFNLIACSEIVTLASWLELRMGIKLSAENLSSVSNELGIEECETLDKLKSTIKKAISSLQLQVNNPLKDMGITLSMAEAPLRTFAEVLRTQGLLGDRVIFCCIDEYENLLNYQQAILNTYIKHAEPPLSYKVGVRKNGLRNRQTLDGQDVLRVPDDCLEIEIADEGFELFAKAVAELRLRFAQSVGAPVSGNLREFLQELSLTEEAVVLGADRVADAILAELNGIENIEFFKEKHKGELYFLKYWQESEGGSLTELAHDWYNNETEWKTRLGNHGYASLFWLSKGRKGARIRKFYCGERTLLSLAAGNIRYFLELIDTAIDYQLNEETPKQQLLTLSPKSQTLAAREVGKRRLNQLEGLADHGVQLKRIVLAIGKVFFELARAPSGKTPEVTSFVLSGSQAGASRIHELLQEGVGHLAFESDPRTKSTSNAELRDDEYRLHRIFSAFFEISHRKKRRMTIDASTLISVIEDRPSRAISTLLDDRPQTTEEELPEQLALFSAFYDGGTST
ncbi:ORC-CDC6 family AAA ATPase [Pseudomonas frigoris]|uniref:ORC-CDC6 family AAA ATPase n=1 Tax=Pseudomonas frigoris TaxID=3398356 RepID=UPI0039EF7035